MPVILKKGGFCMKNSEVLVTKELHYDRETEINESIDELIEIRNNATNDLIDINKLVIKNKNRKKVAKRKYKLEKREAKKLLVFEIKKAKKKYHRTIEKEYHNVDSANYDYSRSLEKKRKAKNKLKEIRSSIKQLRDFKVALGNKYISEEDKYIDINKYSKILKKIDNI